MSGWVGEAGKVCPRRSQSPPAAAPSSTRNRCSFMLKNHSKAGPRLEGATVRVVVERAVIHTTSERRRTFSSTETLEREVKRAKRVADHTLSSYVEVRACFGSLRGRRSRCGTWRRSRSWVAGMMFLVLHVDHRAVDFQATITNVCPCNYCGCSCHTFINIKDGLNRKDALAEGMKGNTIIVVWGARVNLVVQPRYIVSVPR